MDRQGEDHDRILASSDQFFGPVARTASGILRPQADLVMKSTGELEMLTTREAKWPSFNLHDEPPPLRRRSDYVGSKADETRSSLSFAELIRHDP